MIRAALTGGGPFVTTLMAAPRKRKPTQQELKDEQAQRSNRERADAWWPVVARTAGLGIAIVHIFVAQLGPGDIDPGVLGLCATLLLAGAAGKG